MGFKRGTKLTDLGLPEEKIKKIRRLGITTSEEMLDLIGLSERPGAQFNVQNYISGTATIKKTLAESLPVPEATIASLAGPRRPALRRALILSAAFSVPSSVLPPRVRRESIGFDPGSSGFVGRRATGALPPHKRLLMHEAVLAAPYPPSGDPPSCVVNLIPHFQDVRNQGDRGTCVAHAAVALMEYYWSDQEIIDFSEQFLYWFCKFQDNDYFQSGTYQRVAVPLLVSDGVCKERSWRYDPTPDPLNEGQGPPPNRARIFDEAKSFRPSQGIALDPGSSDAIREFLDDEIPVSVSVPVFESWWGQTSTLYGQIPFPRPGEKPEGGHAVCLVGYGNDDDFAGGGFFIVRNSWGEDWALQSPFKPGYGTIPFAYIDNYNWESFALA